MSIPVALAELQALGAERGESAFLLTVTDDARPHVVEVALRWEGTALAAGVGTRTAANAAARPAVSLLYPGRDGGYSLIVDGTAQIAAGDDGPRILVTPTKAVLHRPAASPDPASTCGADCVPILPPAGGRKDA